MGIRCTFVTSFYGPRLPDWFVEKWRDTVSFDSYANSFGFPLASKIRTKAHRVGIIEDIQRVLQETDDGKRQHKIDFVYLHECAGITHIRISKDEVMYFEPTAWKEVEDADGHQHYSSCGPEKSDHSLGE